MTRRTFTRPSFAHSLLASLVFLAPPALPAHAESGPPWIEAQAPTASEIPLPSFAPIIEKLSDAVVNVSIEGTETPPVVAQHFGRPDQGQPANPWEFFFQVPPEMQGKQPFQSLGSGFVIHPDGLIVTNNHVIEKASKIIVSFKDEKKTYNARIIGSDKKTDIALLKVDTGKPLTAVTLGNSDEVRAGDWVIAMGNPFRFGHTSTVGIVSAKSRRLPVGQGGGPYDDFIQTDASINPGNSGGPLFNARGEVIGVNAAIFSPGRMGVSGFNIGIGFAIPVNLVKDIVSQLYKSGHVVRGWLGVFIQPVDQDTADALGLSAAEGALVASVMDKSPAKEAGIQVGDVIVKYNGKKVQQNDELPLMVANTGIGKEVPVEIIRKGDRKTVSVKVRELKDEDEEQQAAPDESEENKLGLSVQDLTPEIARSLGLNDDRGVVVSNVTPGSEADRKGLRRGDVIVEVDSKAVENVGDFRRLTKNLPKKKPILLLVSRGNTTLFFTLKLGE